MIFIAKPIEVFTVAKFRILRCKILKGDPLAVSGLKVRVFFGRHDERHLIIQGVTTIHKDVLGDDEYCYPISGDQILTQEIKSDTIVSTKDFTSTMMLVRNL